MRKFRSITNARLRTTRRGSLVFSLSQPGVGGLSRCAALPGLRRARMWLNGSAPGAQLMHAHPHSA
ncbi:hypothetical protein SAMN05421852_11675 [Thermoflavimicrobium dichotomicum]|uniref:Uncharacterized protein n=1 Tax=Thermoflavimicrobium dichotomicum TaxID=46223 RepID=A0A1I3TAW8_9BACL|nr:hypothetical protein SAMN05421852_11675 [Thermoflavimicrobium dichotomicum]